MRWVYYQQAKVDPMKKLLSFTSVIVVTIAATGSPTTAEEQIPEWAKLMAKSACSYLEQGKPTYEAGELAAVDTLKNSPKKIVSDILIAFDEDNEEEAIATFSQALIRECPKTVIKAGEREAKQR